MKTMIFLGACTIALAACENSPQVDVKNASVGEVAEKVREAGADGSFVNPGKWETKITLLDVNIPGMPPEMAQQMKQRMGAAQGRGFQTCLTPDEAKRPKEDFFAGKSNECRYDHFTMSGGKIDAVLRCDNAAAGSMKMTINGSYSREHYTANTAMEISGGREGGMTMKSQTESRRIGDCTAAEIKAEEAKG